MSATIHIPVVVITTPLKVLFRILTMVIATTILATGIGAVIAAMTGGFKTRYVGTQYKHRSSPVDSDCISLCYIQYTVRTIPGWLRYLFGARSKTESVYVCAEVWLSEEGELLSGSRKRKIQAAALFCRFGIEESH